MWNQISLLPDDPIFGLNILFAKDQHPQKVNLGIGAYKDSEGNPVILPSVHKAEQRLLEKRLNKEYPPMEGLPDFIHASMGLVFGRDHPILSDGRLVGIQTVGGTGALRIGAELVSQKCSKNVFLSNPTWPNHNQIFTFAGLNVSVYPYYDELTHSLDIASMAKAIQAMPKGSLIVLHGCCHNPTGVDPSPAQWQEISHLVKEQGLIPFIDLAYQGFAEDLETDAAAIRLFVADGHEMLVANSFSKNFGLYGERVGSLAIISNDQATSANVRSFVKQLIRSNYSMPPIHGAQIVTSILESESLRIEWENELRQMRRRIIDMRQNFVTGLHALQTPIDFSFINDQAGMFSFSGLNEKLVLLLREKFGIYTPLNGRINIAGLNQSNIDYVVDSISKVLATHET